MHARQEVAMDAAGTRDVQGHAGGASAVRRSEMRVGLDAYTIRDMKRSAAQKLDWAHDHGLDGVQFPSATELSATLDEGDIREAVTHAAGLGLYLDVGVSTINPHKRHSADLDVEQAQLEREIRAARATGT